MYGSTCFGRPHAHNQELNNCSSSLWFYHWSVVIVVLLVVVGPAGDISLYVHQGATNWKSLLVLRRNVDRYETIQIN